MREKLTNKIKQNRAFTLVEMLMALSILIVLLGISLVAINDWSKKLKMTELDNYARTIYLEAQNQLAAMEAEGGLAKFYNELVIEGGQYYDEYNSHKLTQPPIDYDESLYGDSYTRMYYFSSDDGVAASFIPAFSLSNNSSGRYLLEINPESGDVYGVFYWESDNEYVQEYLVKNGTTNVYEMVQDSVVFPNRGTNARTAVQMGYYGGEVTETTVATDYKLNQKVELVNAEELYVKISYDYRGRMLNYLNGATRLDIKVYVTGETSGATWMTEIDIKENDYVNLSNQKLETGLLLDGLRTGQDFESITAGTGLIPGENLVISVETEFEQGSIDITETSNPLAVNSLFNSVSNTGSVHTISFSQVRHLRNLDEEYYEQDIDGSVTILQTKDLDFNQGTYVFDEQGYYVGAASRPVQSISPITNANLFLNEASGRLVSVKGNDYKIKNLVVSAASGTENAGLFAEAKNVSFEYIKLEDFTLNASGCTNVGALAGNVRGGRISHCGVYLAPYYEDANGVKKYYNQETDNDYGTVMARHYANMCVTGGSNVGGLLGRANGTTMSHCYGAVQVKGGNRTGGLIGNAANQTIANCYTSGDVRHVSGSSNRIGGFIGHASSIQVSNCYASGDVYGNNTIGGFLGYSENSNYTNCNSYGQVLNRNGSDNFGASVAVGGFISGAGNINNTDGGGTCHYLKQLGYNTSLSFSDPVDLSASYGDLAALGGSHTTAASFPYDGTLLYKAFPFAVVTDNHYGDWPLQFLINTSLVYYEKYSDGTYGYYSVTTLVDTSETGEVETDDYVWVLDSLEDATCIEDGYALLSMYYLDNFDYVTYQYTGKNQQNSSWVKNAEGNLIVSNIYADNHAVLLRQQGFLEFKAYEKDPSVNEYTVDYSDKTAKDAFTMSGMYLYQLPFELQCTDRYNVYNFYDRLVVYDGYAKGNTGEGAKPVVGGTTIAEGKTFFYSPHFAKTAVNPGLDVESNATLANPDIVHVRSARQLNALGRTPYYWNKKGGATAMSYEQEVDINFSTYTKRYCGQEFNLLAFDQEYSNQPIGEWNGDSSGYGSFQNDYDGNYHKIIDYCVKSDKQYAGLFGEIYKESGAARSQIQNIVMIVSDGNKGNKGNYLTEKDPMKQNNAGLIIGSFVDTSNKSGNNRPRAAVGALVGSDYTIGVTDGDAKVFTIYNCATAGYRVEYHINAPTGGKQPLGIAVGGMVGYSRGNIAQSSAVNDVKLVINESITGNNVAALIGGFAGSCYYGTILNCYSGGTIDVDDNDGNYYLNRLRIAGFCPGWLDAPGISDNDSSEVIRYQNIYSYTSVSENVWEVREDKNGGYFDHLIPVVGRMKLTYEYVWFEGNKWTTESENGASTGVRVPGFSYYLTSVFTDEMIDASGATEYFQASGSNKPKTCDPAAYVQLSNLNWVKSNKDNSAGKTVSFIPTDIYPVLKKATVDYPYHSDLDEKDYPFPAFVKNANGDYVHYGDWPLN